MSGRPGTADLGSAGRRLARPSVRLTLATALLAVLLVGGGAAAARANARSERARIIHELDGHANAAEASVAQFVHGQVLLLETLASLPAVRSADPETINGVFDGLPALNPTFTAVAWIDPNGDVRARTQPRITERVNVADREHVRAVLATGRAYVSSALIPRNPSVAGPSVVIAVPVFDTSGRINGLLGNTITLEILTAVLTPFAGDESSLTVVDRSGRVLVDTEGRGLNEDVSGAALLRRARTAPAGLDTRARNVNGADGRLVAWRSVPAAGWVVFVDRSRSAAFGRIERTYLAIITGLVSVAAAAIAVSVVVGRRMDRHDAERRRAAQALRSSHDQLNAVLDTVDAAITARDRDGRYVFANTAAIRLLGLSGAEQLGLMPAETVPSAVELYDQSGAPVPPEQSPYARARRGERVPEMLLRWRAGPRGRARWIRTRSTPVLDTGGAPALVVSVTADVTEEQRQEAAQRLLADAGAALSGDLDVHQRLQALLRRIVPERADYCSVHLRDDDGAVRRVVAAHRDPERERQLAVQYPAALPEGGSGPLSTVLRSGRGLLMDEAERLSGPAATPDSAYRSYLDLLAPESVVAAPLVARGGVIGVLTLVMAGSGRRFSAADVPLAEELGRRAGMAVENARLYIDARRAEEETRHQAERVAVLAAASRAFAEASQVGTAMAGTVARTVAQATGDGCIVRLIDRTGGFGPAACAHVEPAAEAEIGALLEALTIDASARLPGEVVREGRTLILPRSGTPLREQVHPAFHRYIERTGTTGLLLAPLRVHGRVVGVMTLARDRGRPPYTEPDAAFVQELAGRAAVALDNALLQDAEREARDRAEAAAGRIARLQAVTAGLAEALTVEDVAEVALAQGLAALGAYAGAIFLLSADGAALEALRLAGYPGELTESWRRFAITQPVPPAQAVRESRAIWLGDVAAEGADYPELVSAARAGGTRAHASIPLIVEGRCIGVFNLSFHERREFAEAERELGAALARQCAQALERARRYEAERAARAEAEAANRAKDDFLSTLSHELRTPLTSMLGWARLLRSRRLDPATAEEGLATIERATRTQARLIEELLDVSRIVSGKLSLDLQPVELLPLLRAAVESVRPAADLKGITLITALDPDSGALRADPVRLQQVFGNLLGNAVKFTPAGGRISVRLQRAGAQARVTVEDTGIGFSEEFAPHLFERFRQADASSTREHGGLGLGLAIVKSLVELHGGDIQAASPGPGKGARFTVTLPLRPPERQDGMPIPGPAAAVAQPEMPPLEGVRVLWVEDDAGIRTLVAAVLEGAGAQVQSCAAGEEALAAAAEDPPDLLVSDIGLPLLDGYDLLRRLRRGDGRLANLPALALTAYAGAEDRERALAAGFDGYLPKPVEPAQLVQAVLRLTGRAAPA